MCKLCICNQVPYEARLSCDIAKPDLLRIHTVQYTSNHQAKGRRVVLALILIVRH